MKWLPYPFPWYHILKATTCVSYTAFTLLHFAALYNQTQFITTLVEQHLYDVRAKDQGGRTALHIACSVGHIESVRQLVAYDAEGVFAQTVSCATPLHKALDNGHVAVVDFLLHAGADMDATCELFMPPSPNHEFPVSGLYNGWQLLRHTPYTQKSLPYANWDGRQYLIEHLKKKKNRSEKKR